MRQNNLGNQTDRTQQNNPFQNQQLQYMANQGNQSSRTRQSQSNNNQVAMVKSYFEPQNKGTKSGGTDQVLRSKGNDAGSNGTNQMQQVNISGGKPPVTSRQPRQVQINQVPLQKQQSTNNPQMQGHINVHGNTEIKNMVVQPNNQANSTGGIDAYQPLRNMQRSNTAGKHGAQQQLTINQGQNLPTTSVGHRTGGLKFKNNTNAHLSPPNSNPNFPLGTVFDHIPQMNATTGQIQSNDQIQPALSPRPGKTNQPQRTPNQGGNLTHQSHDGLIAFTQARSPDDSTIQNQTQTIKSSRQANAGNQQQTNTVTNSHGPGQNNTPQLSNFHPPTGVELGNMLPKGRQRHQNIRHQTIDDRYSDKNSKLRANTTSEARKLKDQQQNKGDKRSAADKHLILAVSHNNGQGDQNATQNPHPSRYSPPGKRLIPVGEQHPLSVSQDRPVSKRGPVEDPFFQEGTTSKGHIPRPAKGYMQGQKNSNLTIQPPSISYTGLQTQQAQLTERNNQQSSRIQNQTLDTYHFQNPQTISARPMHSNGSSNQNHNIPQIRKANLREIRKSHRLQQNGPEAKQAHNPNMNTLNPLTSIELAQQFNKHQREKAVAAFNNNNTGPTANEPLSPSSSKSKSPLKGQPQSIPLKSSRNKDVQRSLDSRRQILPHGGFMKDGPYLGGNQMITPTVGSHNQVNRSQDFTRVQEQNKSASNVAQNAFQGGQLRNKRGGKKTATNQSYSHGQMQNELMKELNFQKARKQFANAEDTVIHTQQPINLANPGRPLMVGLQSERHKRNRQNFQVANSLTGLSARGSSHQDITPDLNNPQQKQENATDMSQKEIVDKERFNAITKFAFATSCGHQPGNPYKVNQDTYTLTPNMCGQQGFHLFSVCDGHGINGHKVSGEIKIELPKLLEQRLKQDADFLENNQTKEFQERLPKYFRDCFEQIHESFFSKTYDCHLSGSTVTSVLFDSKRIYCANAGDSRAVLYTQSKKGGIKVTPLSDDHKPSLPKEKARVEKCNGRVEPIIGPQGQYLGPDRVWMLNEDTPGLAMSRSLGDGLAHSIGVSWEPEVKQLNLEPADKFIVIASDGVWEFLTNETVARIVWPYYVKNSPEQAGNAIVRAAAQKWKENDTVIDDITCITIFLEVE